MKQSMVPYFLSALMMSSGVYDQPMSKEGMQHQDTRAEVEKRVIEQIKNKKLIDKYPEIVLSPKEKRKCKTWVDIQNMKRLKSNKNE